MCNKKNMITIVNIKTNKIIEITFQSNRLKYSNNIVS